MPNVSAAIVNEFQRVFSGHKKIYGVTILKGTKKDNGKVETISVTKSSIKGDSELSYELYKEHLEGKKGLGVAPIDENNNCRFGVIDVDDYKIDVFTMLKVVVENDLPFKLFRSKSGGIHCYLFFSEEVKASQVRAVLKKFLLIFGLPTNTEIFPKQDKLFSSGSPSWINLPYFGGNDTYMYADNGKPTLFESAYMAIENKRVTLEKINSIYSELPINDGPVCLQSLYLRSSDIVDGTGRDSYLFNMGVYLKASNSTTFEERLLQVNMMLGEPKDSSKIHQQIIAPIQKKSYSYRCSEHPLCDYCLPDLCRERKYGKESDEISSLSFEELKQVMTNPPHYIWIVNGHEMVFYKESELRDQTSFADQCMRFLHIVPNIIKRPRWLDILNKAFKEIKIEEVDPEADMSPGALLIDYFKEYLTQRPKAQSRPQIKNGYIWIDDAMKCFIFKKTPLFNYLQNEKSFRFFSPTKMQKRLTEFGVYSKIYYIEKNWNERVWVLPIKNIKEEYSIAEDKVDFSDLEKKETEEF